jgi:hypothetical protein
MKNSNAPKSNHTAACFRARMRTRGAVMVEYAFLLLTVGMPVAAGTIAGGKALLSEYKTARTFIMLPIP